MVYHTATPRNVRRIFRNKNPRFMRGLQYYTVRFQSDAEADAGCGNVAVQYVLYLVTTACNHYRSAVFERFFDVFEFGSGALRAFAGSALTMRLQGFNVCDELVYVFSADALDKRFVVFGI